MGVTHLIDILNIIERQDLAGKLAEYYENTDRSIGEEIRYKRALMEGIRTVEYGLILLKNDNLGKFF